MTIYIKYPRTFHLPWSEGITTDDKVLKDVSHLEGQDIVITEKMDGENTTLYSDYVHARSLTYSDHPSRHWIKQFHAQIKQDIPRGWRICGENLFAKHSIGYGNLESFFLCFSIWDAGNFCLGWDETCEILQLMGITPVPTLFRGRFEERVLQDVHGELYNKNTMEGYVVRLARSFHYTEFQTSVAKFVRSLHVGTDKHWMYQTIITNQLRSKQ
jgi:hypothetical protein